MISSFSDAGKAPTVPCARKCNKGRTPGAQNKLNRQCKEMIATCFENIGGIKGLTEWAKTHRTEFYCRLYARLIGLEVHISDGTNKTYDTPEEIGAAFALQGVPLEAIEALQRMGRLQEIETRLIDVTPSDNRSDANGDDSRR
jgi:hypothetical protein